MIKCRLEEIMLTKGITVDMLVKNTGVNKITIEKLKANKTKIIQFKTLNALCKYLNCDSNDLLKNY